MSGTKIPQSAQNDQAKSQRTSGTATTGRFTSPLRPASTGTLSATTTRGGGSLGVSPGIGVVNHRQSAAGCVEMGLAADQLLEGGLVADRIEVRIVLCVRARRLGHIDRATEVIDRVGRPAGEALAAGEVVEQLGVLGMSLDQLRVLGRPPRRTRPPRRGA